jgi:hypothetical protein
MGDIFSSRASQKTVRLGPNFHAWEIRPVHFLLRFFAHLREACGIQVEPAVARIPFEE